MSVEPHAFTSVSAICRFSRSPAANVVPLVANVHVRCVVALLWGTVRLVLPSEVAVPPLFLERVAVTPQPEPAAFVVHAVTVVVPAASVSPAESAGEQKRRKMAPPVLRVNVSSGSEPA